MTLPVMFENHWQTAWEIVLGGVIMILRNPVGSRLRFLDPSPYESTFGQFFDMLFLQRGRVKRRIKEGEEVYFNQFPPEERAAKREEFNQLSLEDQLAEVLRAYSPDRSLPTDWMCID